MSRELSTLDRIVGMCVTAGLTLFFFWGAVQWFARDQRPAEQRTVHRDERELKAFERLQHIVRAQEWYREIDRNQDGKKAYAPFLVHLWQTVSERDSSVIPVKLIDRELAFCRSRKEGLDGYHYRILCYREPVHVGAEKAPTELQPLDLTREWGAAAYPVAEPISATGETRRGGRLAFLIDTAGQIYARPDSGDRVRQLPAEAKAAGWIPVDDSSDIEHALGVEPSE